MSSTLSAEQLEGIEWNRLSWNDRVQAHWDSAMYRKHADALRRGGHGLAEHIVRGVGPVEGQSLVHLQCHMGMETMAWSRLGAKATGLDFSLPAIDKAVGLRDELALDTHFVCGNVYDARELIEGQFDVVFVSIGSLCWLPDVKRWSRVVASLLRPGGRLFLNDVHPLMDMLEDKTDEPAGFGLHYPYLGGDRVVCDEDGTYADDTVGFTHNRNATWGHPLGDVVTGLIEAGLRITRLEESSRCVWPALKVMERVGEDRWEFPEPWRGKIPVDFTLIAEMQQHDR
ncbi:MAG: class I SAM-dependent methyltransferase [Planctomycetota bacterium]